MKKALAWMLAVLMMLSSCAALAEGAYTMAGYDGDGTSRQWDTNLFFQRMEERTGVRFTFHQYADYTAWMTEKSALLSGEDKPDVLFKAELTPAETQRYYADGLLIDLSPYLEKNAPNLWALLESHPDWKRAITLPDGAIVALPTINELQNNNAMWINRTWLDAFGLAVPTTAEELTKVLRAFKAGDPNRNGKADEVPLTFTSIWDLKFLAHAFGLIANDYNVVMAEDGTVSSVLQTEENRAFLTWLHTLWEERLIDRNGFSSSDSMRRVTDSDAVMTYGLMLGTSPLTLLPTEAIDEYELLMPLRCDGKQVYRDLTGDLVRGAFAITSACEDPAELLRWVDYLYTPEGCFLAQAGAEDVEYVWNEDGTWAWIDDTQTVASVVLADATIAEGGAAPMLSTVEFQETYDDEQTRRTVTQLSALKAVSRMPYPLVYLAPEKAARLNELQADIGLYADQQMTWFVTGDVPLSDESWADFCRTLDDKGLAELVEILAEAAAE